MFLKHNILANYVSLAHVPNPSIPVSGFLARRGCLCARDFQFFYSVWRSCMLQRSVRQDVAMGEDIHE